jgi:hypothetical protein
MTATKQNSTRINKVPDYLLERALKNTEAMVPLSIFIPRPSPHLGFSGGRLARDKTGLSRWGAAMLKATGLPLISSAFDYILKRAAVIPSRLYRQLDLPLFRRKHRPRGSTRPSEVLDESTSGLRTGRPDMPPEPSDDQGAEGPLFYLADEAYPAMMPDLWPHPAPLNGAAAASYGLSTSHPPTLIPSITLPPAGTEPAAAADNPLTAGDNQEKTVVKNTFPTATGQPAIHASTKTSLKRPVIPGKPLQPIQPDRMSSRVLGHLALLKPSAPQEVKSGETSARNDAALYPPADGERPSPAGPAAMTGQPDTTAAKTITGKTGAVPPSRVILIKKSLSPQPLPEVALPAEAADGYGQEKRPLTGAEPSALPEAEIRQETSLKQNAPAIQRTILRKDGHPSEPRIPDTLNGLSSKPSPLLANELGEEATVPDNSDGYPIGARGQLSRGILNQQSLKPIALRKSARLLPHQTAPVTENLAVKFPTGEPAANPSTHQLLHESEVAPPRREENKTTYHSETPGNFTHNGTGAEQGPFKRKASNASSGLETQATDSLLTEAYPNIGNISSLPTSTHQLALKSRPLIAAGENSADMPGTESIFSPPHYQYTRRKLLDLPVVTAAQLQPEPGAVPAGELFRSSNRTPPELARSLSYSAPGPASVPVTRVVGEPSPPSRTGANQQSTEKKNAQVTAPDIRAIAEKVYAILRQELKIERERGRHRRLR